MMNDIEKLKLEVLAQCNGNLDAAKQAYEWLTGVTLESCQSQRDELFAETKRAQAIIDSYRPHIQLVHELASFIDPLDTPDSEAELECFASIIRNAKGIVGDLSDEADDNSSPASPEPGEGGGVAIHASPESEDAPGCDGEQDKTIDLVEVDYQGRAYWEGFDAMMRGSARDASHMRSDLVSHWLDGWDAKGMSEREIEDQRRRHFSAEAPADQLRKDDEAMGAIPIEKEQPPPPQEQVPEGEMRLEEINGGGITIIGIDYAIDYLDELVDGLTPNQMSELRGFVYRDEDRMDVIAQLNRKFGGYSLSHSSDLCKAVARRMDARYSGMACAAAPTDQLRKDEGDVGAVSIEQKQADLAMTGNAIEDPDRDIIDLREKVGA